MTTVVVENEVEIQFEIEITTEIGIEFEIRIEIQIQIEIAINVAIKSQPAFYDSIPPVHITIEIKNKNLIVITIATAIEMARKIAIQIIIEKATTKIQNIVRLCR